MEYDKFVLKVRSLLGPAVVIERVNEPIVTASNVHKYKNRLVKINGRDTHFVVVNNQVFVTVTRNDGSSIVAYMADEDNIKTHLGTCPEL